MPTGSFNVNITHSSVLYPRGDIENETPNILPTPRIRILRSCRIPPAGTRKFVHSFSPHWVGVIGHILEKSIFL